MISHEVKKNGAYVPVALPLNFRTVFRISNSLFRGDSIAGTNSIPFKVPAKGNGKCFNFPEQPNRVSNTEYVESIMKLNGLQFCCGQTKVICGNCEQYDLQFNDNQGEFKRLVENLSIRDCADEEVQIPCDNFIHLYAFCIPYVYENETYDSSQEFTLTINGSQLGPFSGSTPGEVINELELQFSLLTPAVTNGQIIAHQLPPPYNVAGDGPFYCLVIKQLDPNQPFVVDYEIPGYSEWVFYDETFPAQYLNECIADHALNANIADGNHVFYPVQLPNAYDDSELPWNGYVNQFHQGAFLTNSFDPNIFGLQNVQDYTDYAFVPMVKLKWVLERIFSKIGWQTKGDLLEDECFCKLTFWNNVNIDQKKKYTANSDGSTYFVNAAPESYNLGNHVPDISVIDFIDYIAKEFGVAFIFSKFEKCVEFKSYKSNIENPKKVDWKHVVCGEPLNCLQTKIGYRLEYSSPIDDKKWDVIDGHFEPYVVGDGENPITTGFSSLHDDIGTVFFGSLFAGDLVVSNRKTPCVDQPLGSLGSTDFGSQILFYHGYHEDSNGDLYPFASHSNTNYNGDVVCAWSLDSESKYNYWWKAWLDMLSKGNEISIDLLPGMKEILQYDDATIYEFEVNVGGAMVAICAFIKSLELNVNDCGIAKSSAVLWQVR